MSPTANRANEHIARMNASLLHPPQPLSDESVNTFFSVLRLAAASRLRRRVGEAVASNLLGMPQPCRSTAANARQRRRRALCYRWHDYCRRVRVDNVTSSPKAATRAWRLDVVTVHNCWVASVCCVGTFELICILIARLFLLEK